MDREKIALEFIRMYKRYKDKNLKAENRPGLKKSKDKITSRQERENWKIYP